MSRYICDFHIHSKYSRATSREMDIAHLAEWAKIKGISLLGSGDFTHPQWLAELKGALESKGEGIFRHAGVDFILSTEISNIYFKAGRTRKIHNIIFSPDFNTADEINSYLRRYGNLEADGRPMLSLDSGKMVKELLRINPDCMIVPAHIWTPHFSLFGSNSGFDRIEECFEDQTQYIYSFETGLSSDPAMNWRWSKLDRFTLMSNSDAHSPSKIGREANIFNAPITYKELIEILKNKDKSKFLYTVEFFPQEGKYHWDGHRPCDQRLSPKESKDVNNRCPACGRKLTIGVMNRVESLSDREEGYELEDSPYFKNLVPLVEIIASALGMGAESVTVQKEYNKLIRAFGSEFKILLDVPKDEILKHAPPKIGKGIVKVREGNVEVIPGYDGVYGKIRVFKEGDEEAQKQMTFF
ncbi:endonuclease Q family protein [Omnitrophica bacterium]|nr:endonuclease Q family protein [Candidatus Omnitrophota bacterium]